MLPGTSFCDLASVPGLLLRVFARVPVADLPRLAAVCRAWRRALAQPQRVLRGLLPFVLPSASASRLSAALLHASPHDCAFFLSAVGALQASGMPDVSVHSLLLQSCPLVPALSNPPTPAPPPLMGAPQPPPCLSSLTELAVANCHLAPAAVAHLGQLTALTRLEVRALETPADAPADGRAEAQKQRAEAAGGAAAMPAGGSEASDSDSEDEGASARVHCEGEAGAGAAAPADGGGTAATGRRGPIREATDSLADAGRVDSRSGAPSFKQWPQADTGGAEEQHPQPHWQAASRQGGGNGSSAPGASDSPFCRSLAQLTALRDLSLSGGRGRELPLVGPLRCLPSLRLLRRLSLEQAALDGAAAAQLRWLGRLQELWLKGVRVVRLSAGASRSGVGEEEEQEEEEKEVRLVMAGVASLRSLRLLSLEDLPLVPAALPLLARLSCLRDLSMADVRWLGPLAAQFAFLSRLQRLSSLSVCAWTKARAFPAGTVVAGAACAPSLACLSLSAFSPADLRMLSLLGRLPALSRLSLDLLLLPPQDPPCLAALRAVPRLHSLVLRNARAAPAETGGPFAPPAVPVASPLLASLCRVGPALPRLQELCLDLLPNDSTPGNDVSLAVPLHPLASLPGLASLALSWLPAAEELLALRSAAPRLTFLALALRRPAVVSAEHLQALAQLAGLREADLRTAAAVSAGGLRWLALLPQLERLLLPAEAQAAGRALLLPVAG